MVDNAESGRAYNHLSEVGSWIYRVRYNEQFEVAWPYEVKIDIEIVVQLTVFVTLPVFGTFKDILAYAELIVK